MIKEINKSKLISDANRLSINEFNDLASLIYTQCGIKLPIAKKVMLESRLAKRLRALNFSGFKEYISYLKSKEGEVTEMIQMIDVVTTNKTDFFREPHHFDYLTQVIVPEFIKNSDYKKTINIWSSACSSGEEPYTLAIVLQQMVENNRNFDYKISATDISTDVLEKAVTGVYNPDRISGIPLSIKQKYFLKSKNNVTPTVRVVQELRQKIQFQRLNLMDRILEIDGMFDVIFCRNVLIYFDRETQEDVITRLITKLKPGGYFFIGHSESLHQMKVQLKQVKPTVYQKI